jgi:hypothetical protein
LVILQNKNMKSVCQFLEINTEVGGIISGICSDIY